MGTAMTEVGKRALASGELHSKTRKQIEKFGPEEVHRRLVVLARVYRRNDSPLAAGTKKEAELIAQIFNIGVQT